MPAASNISQINQQYIKVKTDKRLKNWRQDYNEINSHKSVQGYYFPVKGDIYDTLNPALQLIIISECIA